MPRAAGEGTFFGSVPPLAAERGAEGQGADVPDAAPTAAGQGAAPPYGAQDAIRELNELTDEKTTVQELRRILAKVRPPLEWLNHPDSEQYRQVFIGLDPQVQPAFPGLPRLQVRPSVNREAAKFYLEMHQRGGRKKLSRKHNASRRRTRRGPLRRATRSRRTRSRV